MSLVAISAVIAGAALLAVSTVLVWQQLRPGAAHRSTRARRRASRIQLRRKK
jgi:hypothetical protein